MGAKQVINETLVAAAQYMDEHGWTRGVSVDHLGRVCMGGAIKMVTDDDELVSLFSSEYYKAWTHLVDYALNLGGVSPVVYNDRILKTKEETVKFMMAAAEWEPRNV
jgi:hypothetical protein